MSNSSYSIPRTGKVILCDLHEVITEIRNLQNICPQHTEALERCEKQLNSIAFEVASVCTDGDDTNQVEAMMKDAGIEIPDDLLEAIRQLEDDSDSARK